jgi:mono/diheme cytochrome c family protein
VLTVLAWREDHNGATPESQHYLAAVASAESEAERAVTLANSPAGIPPTGALALLRSDPKIQGPKLFRQHCAACHSHAPDSQDAAIDPLQIIAVDKPSASNLWNFGTLEWTRGILDPDKVGGPHYFGNTKFKDGDMAKFVKEKIGDELAKLKGDEQIKLRQSVGDVALAVTVESGRKIDGVADLDKRLDAGRKAVVDVFACIDCHKFGKEGDVDAAPDLTGYASREWLTAFISNPADDRFYRDTNDRMPAFAPHLNDPANRLSPEDLATLVSWLCGEWYEPTNEAAGK